MVAASTEARRFGLYDRVTNRGSLLSATAKKAAEHTGESLLHAGSLPTRITFCLSAVHTPWCVTTRTGMWTAAVASSTCDGCAPRSRLPLQREVWGR
jgi:hypothetical protein